MRLLKSILPLLLLCLATVAHGQNLSEIDFRTIKVDQLSGQQVQQILAQAQSRGLSIDQIVQAAVARGMPQAEARKLNRRLRQARLNLGDGAAARDTDSRLRTQPADTSRLRSILQDTTLFGPAFVNTPEYLRYQFIQDSLRFEKNKLKDKIFGYSLFTQQQSSFQPALNIPTPENYQLGPGDEVIIDIWGAAQATYQLTVSPDGMILVENIGPVYLNGLTVEEAAERVRRRLSEIYSGLGRSDSPNEDIDTHMMFSLGQVRSIDVTVLGEAAKPGTYTISSLSTVFNALVAAGGPSTTGSFRKIDIIRGDSTFATFDLYDILIYGDQSENIRLRSQDIIQIHPYIDRVEIEGEIKRPGLYELKGSETLGDLINYAGEFTDKAYTGRVKVIGNTPTQKRIADVEQSDFSEYNLKNGDLVTVGRILDRFANRVQIEGAVFRPGDYALQDTTTLYSLIQRAEGLKEDAFLNRGIIYRTRDDYTIEAIAFNVREVIRNPEKNDIKLVREDIVRISSIFDLRENFTVNIKGPVQNPDTYEFVYGMTLEDIIFKSGGFKQSAAPYRIEVARRIRDIDDRDINSNTAKIYTFHVDENLKLSEEGADFELQPFDQVYIRQLPNYQEQQEVTIFGEIKFPGKYSISSRDERISDLLERAGGLTPEAYLKGATLFREKEFVQQQAQQTLANVEGLTLEEQEQQIQEQRTRENAQIGINLPEVLESPGSRFDLFLEKGDSLFIPKQLQTVSIQGGVFYPTTVRHREGSSFKDYITAAGGFTDLAKKSRAYVIYPNGDVDRVKRFLFFKSYPDVVPGASIVVPEKMDPIQLSPQERIAIYSSITSTLALIVTTIIQVRR